MRTVDTLFELEEIPILLQYLYMSEDHYITVHNKVTDLEIRMTEDCSFLAKNLSFPEVPAIDYTETMTVMCMLAIIDQLKHAPAVEFTNKFKSRWEEIKAITIINVAQNKMNQRE